MEVKYQLRTDKIKGINFHPHRSWIIISTYKGSVNIIDYRLQSILKKYEVTPDSCIRSVAFHPTQPIFICGGHDHKVYVYDYNASRRVSSLEGHADYVRSVTFHHTYPLALSSSDDQTMRIWNWQSKKHMVLLSGHKHYVMSAKFHHEKNLIISASLDQTIRLWNFSRMVEKMNTAKGVINPLDVELVAVVDAHDKGSNWASFHPTQDLILSAGDDRRVKVWRYDDSSITERETFFGHQYNVCCVEASPKTGHILSNSEDCTLRVWDNTGICIDTFTKAGEKQWIIDCHKNLPYVAIGTDNSLVILSLDSTRICNQTFKKTAFLVKDFDFKMVDLAHGGERTLIEEFHRPSSGSLRSARPVMIKKNNFNKSKYTFIVEYNKTKTSDSKVFLVEVNKKTYEAQKKHIPASSAIFIGKNKIAYLNNGNVELSDSETLLSLGSVKAVKNVDQIYSGGIGKIILKTRSVAQFYDTVAKKQIGTLDEFPIKKMREAIWNKNSSICAIICRKTIFLMNKNFKKLARIDEGSQILSAIWTKENALVYTTYNHIKYTLSNGDKGIMKSIDDIRYPTALIGSVLHCFDQDGNHIEEEVSIEDLLFKKSIQVSDISKVKAFIKNNKTTGNALISYLCKKNYPSVALSLTTDDKTKFQLALRSGNLQAAYEAAENLKKKECYQKLAQEALKQGCNPLIEIGYQESQNWQKLAFFNLVSGNLGGLSELEEYIEDKMTHFNIALYTGDIKKRIKIFSENGQLALAYQMAKVHGLEDYAEAIRKGIPEVAKNIKWSKKSTALLPPKPIIKDYKETCEIMNGWPIFEVSEEKQAFMNLDSDEDDEAQEIGGDDLEEAEEDEVEEDAEDIDLAAEGDIGDDWDVDLDLGGSDLSADEGIEGEEDVTGELVEGDVHVFVQKDDPVEASVNKNSLLPSDFVSIGRFDLANEKLESQIGLQDPSAIKKSYLDIFMSSQFFSSPFAFIPPKKIYVTKENDKKSPYISNTLKTLEKTLKSGYDLTTKAKFSDAIKIFREIILKIPLLSLNSKSDLPTAEKILEIAVEYVFALKCDQLKKKIKDKREIIYLTIAMSLMNLQPAHRMLTLRSALSVCFKTKNYILSAYIARRLLKLFSENPKLAKEALVKQVKKILAKSEKIGTNAIDLDFEETNFYDTEIVQKLNPVTMKFLGEGKTKSSALSKAKYPEEFLGKLCEIDRSCEIGKECLGMKLIK